ncbi:type II secretion system protein [Photobacterium leiognathi]|uniref:type II secretion system protein n=1 Tax=Photobacterium leiognathi TaxID=553611 RepID=UPI0029812847|nr:type II secretion system protein [Photobacterium leiognathi]
MKRQGGFTLIELVVVIVILGILAVTAAPKFMNLQNDARKASLEGLKGSIQGAAGIVYGKAAIKGLESVDASKADAGKKPNVDGIDITFGYPVATSAALGAAVNGLGSDWTCQNAASSDPAAIQCSFKNNTEWTANKGCYVQYQQAKSASEAASTTVVVTGSSCK